MNGADDVVPPQRETHKRPEIVVATDGSAAAAVAVRYALDLATRGGAPLRIVHVIPVHVPVPVHLEEDIREAGKNLIEDIARRAQHAAPQVDLRLSLLEGPRAFQLMAAAREAEMVILGRSGGASMLLTGSTATALVEHVERPVRVVPPGWFKATSRSEVIVAVKDAAKALPLIQRGFEIAAELGEPLVLLHAWGLPSGYEEVMARADTQSWNDELADRIDAEVRVVRDAHPEVTYEVRVVHGRTIDVLEDASRRASFILVGRTCQHHPVGVRTDIPHVLMNVSDCPVEVGPEPRSVAAPTAPRQRGQVSR